MKSEWNSLTGISSFILYFLCNLSAEVSTRRKLPSLKSTELSTCIELQKQIKKKMQSAKLVLPLKKSHWPMAKIFASQMSSLEQFFKPTVIASACSQLPAGWSRPHMVSHRCRQRNCSLSISEHKQVQERSVPPLKVRRLKAPKEFIILRLRSSESLDFFTCTVATKVKLRLSSPNKMEVIKQFNKMALFFVCLLLSNRPKKVLT